MYRYDPTDPVSGSPGCGRCDNAYTHRHWCGGRHRYTGTPAPTRPAHLHSHRGLSVTTRSLIPHDAYALAVAIYANVDNQALSNAGSLPHGVLTPVDGLLLS